MKPRCRPTRTPTGCRSCTRSGSFDGNYRSSEPFPPQDRPALHKAVLDEILQERVPPRAPRRNKRGVKRKMSSFPVRRKADRPPPPVDIAKAIRILALESLCSPTEAATRSDRRFNSQRAPRRENPG